MICSYNEKIFINFSYDLHIISMDYYNKNAIMIITIKAPASPRTI